MEAGIGVTGQALPGTLLGEQDWGHVDLASVAALILAVQSSAPLKLGFSPTTCCSLCLLFNHLLPLPAGHPHLLLQAL